MKFGVMFYRAMAQQTDYEYYVEGTSSGPSGTVQSRGESGEDLWKLQGEPPRCAYCDKYHPGVCRRITGECYRCGKLGHFVRNCPKSSRVKQVILGPTPTNWKPQNPFCLICGKRHPGKCRLYTGACFRCGNWGHKISECPRCSYVD